MLPLVQSYYCLLKSKGTGLLRNRGGGCGESNSLSFDTVSSSKSSPQSLGVVLKHSMGFVFVFLHPSPLYFSCLYWKNPTSINEVYVWRAITEKTNESHTQAQPAWALLFSPPLFTDRSAQSASRDRKRGHFFLGQLFNTAVRWSY